MLLEAKADPAQACFGGATPLYVACSRNHADVAKLLVRAGAPVDAVANGYYTPMLSAVTHGCDDVARVLLGAGADANFWSEKWGTLLHAAADVHAAAEVDAEAREEAAAEAAAVAREPGCDCTHYCWSPALWREWMAALATALR